MPSARRELTRRNAANDDATGIAATEQPRMRRPADNLDPFIDPVGNPAKERFCQGDDQRLGREQDPGLVRPHAPGEQDEREERLERPEGKVGRHIDKCRGPQLPVCKERTKTFPERGEREDFQRTCILSPVHQDQDEDRKGNNRRSKINNPVGDEPGVKDEERDDRPAGQRCKGPSDQGGGRVPARASPRYFPGTVPQSSLRSPARGWPLPSRGRTGPGSARAGRQ